MREAERERQRARPPWTTPCLPVLALDSPRRVLQSAIGKPPSLTHTHAHTPRPFLTTPSKQRRRRRREHRRPRVGQPRRVRGGARDPPPHLAPSPAVRPPRAPCRPAPPPPQPHPTHTYSHTKNTPPNTNTNRSSRPSCCSARTAASATCDGSRCASRSSSRSSSASCSTRRCRERVFVDPCVVLSMRACASRGGGLLTLGRVLLLKTPRQRYAAPRGVVLFAAPAPFRPFRPQRARGTNSSEPLPRPLPSPPSALAAAIRRRPRARRKTQQQLGAALGQPRLQGDLVDAHPHGRRAQGLRDLRALCRLRGG